MKRYGAVFASPNIRGGGEFGEEWHLAGTRERKVHSSTRAKNDALIQAVDQRLR